MPALALTVLFTACSKNDQDAVVPVNKQSTQGGLQENDWKPRDTTATPHVALTPADTVSSFIVYFTDPETTTVQEGQYEDLDGAGPLLPNIGGVALNANTKYIVTFRIEDATNGKGSTVFIDDKIKADGKDFKICISNPLGIIISPTDSDGSLPIGLENELITGSTKGSCNMSFTIRYQKDVKNGDCAPGINYFTCSLPVTIN